MVKVIIFSICGIFYLTFSSTCFASREKEACDIMKTFERVQNKKAPVKIDKYTDLIEVSVNCKIKTLYTTKAYNVSKSQLPANWEETLQKNHTKTNCKKTGLSGGFGWTAISKFFYKDSVHIFTIKTSPKDC